MDICKLITSFDAQDVVVFDTETTGVSGSDEMLSIAIVDAYGNDVFNSLIRPTRKRSWPDAERIHHISPQMVQAAPTANECRDAILGALENKLVVGYNVDFDLRMLGQSIVDIEDFSPTTFDVMKEYAKVHGRRMWEDSGRFKYSKLFECAEDYGYSFIAHDAHEDALATAYCFMSLICDEFYVRRMLYERNFFNSKISLNPLKAMCDNIQTLVGDRERVTMPGTLVVGQITRGKRKGQKRYECVVNEMKVGVVPESYNATIFSSCQDSSNSFPEPVNVDVTMGSVNGRQYSEAVLKEGTTLDDILICARESKPNPSDYASKHSDGAIAPISQTSEVVRERHPLKGSPSPASHVTRPQTADPVNVSTNESQTSYSLPTSILGLVLLGVAILFGLSAVFNLFRGNLGNTVFALLVALIALFIFTRLPTKDS